MVRLSVRDDFARMERILTDFERRQLPFALARALTGTAKDAQADEQAALPSAFDRPTPFTQRGIGVVTATKATLQAEVFVRPIQAKYLGLRERGGTRQPKRSALVNPVDIKKNQYGNIPYRSLQRLKRRKDVFVGKVKGIGGVWQRPKGSKGKTGKLTLLMRFAGPEKVQAHPWFMPVVTKTVKRVFPTRMRDALAEALRTARR